MSPDNESTFSSKHVLEPIERISEILFGLIMVLTFTCSFSVAESGHAEIRAMLLGALGCNLAWGIIDGIMYLMGCLAGRARALALLREVRKSCDPEKARRLVSEALPPVFAPLFDQTQLENMRNSLQQAQEPPTHPRLSGSDWRGAFGVCLLVIISTCPVVIPFAVLQNAMRAQRLSNAIAICLLFATGYAFGRCTGYDPRKMGLAMVLLGGVLVGLTIMLGG